MGGMKEYRSLLLVHPIGLRKRSLPDSKKHWSGSHLLLRPLYTIMRLID